MPASSQPSPNGTHPPHANGTPYPSEGQDGTEQLRETLGLLQRGKWTILAVLALVMGAAVAYTLWVPPEYETSSLLLVEMKQTPVTQGMDLNLQKKLGTGGGALENELLVLRQSEDIARRVAGRLTDLRDTLDARARTLSILHSEAGESLTRAQVAARLSGHMRAQAAGRDVDAIQITGMSTRPAEAALIANLYAQEYITRTREKSRADLHGSREFLEVQEEKMQTKLQGLEDRIRRYMSQEGAAALDQEASRTVEQIAALEAQRDETRIELRMKQAALSSLREELKNIEPKLVERASSEAGQSLGGVLEQLKVLNLRIEQTYQENPDLRDGTAQNETLEREMEKLEQHRRRLRTRADALSKEYVNEVLAAGGITLSTGEGEGGEGGRGLAYVAQQRREATQRQIEISGLEAKLEALSQRLAEYREKLKDIPRQSIELAQMQRARQSTESLYSFIVERLQEVRIAEESEIGYAEILRHAGVPATPVRPNKRRNLMLAILAGLLLGGGLVLLRHRLDTRLHQPGDLREKGHSVVGVIPDMKRMIDEEFGGEQYVTIEGRRLRTALPMLLGPMSGLAEAYRRLRTNIQFSRPDTVIKTLLVASPEQSEGKSTVSANLALAMAQAGRRTVLVDADLRRPQVHRFFGLDREPGLSEILFEQQPFEADAFATGTDDFYAIPAGSSVPNPTELLGSRKMRDFIRTLRDQFDVVIFDTPPALTFSDALLLSTQCDATVVIALADKTDERAFEHASEAFDNVGAHLIGGVMNRFDPYAGAYGYGYGYAYRYGRPEQYYAPEQRAGEQRAGASRSADP